MERSGIPGYDFPKPIKPRSGDTIRAVSLMANTYTQLLLHVVFSTKNRQRTLPDGHRDALYKYIWGIHQHLNCHLYRIGGIDDHVHILTGMPTTLALAKYVQEIKSGSSHWLKTQAGVTRHG
jgi:REP element-mobilizing transposase RayT